MSAPRCHILWLNLLLVLTILIAYWQVGSHDFISFDTPGYINLNQHVNSGLTRENIIWAFTTTYEGNWFPLTWLSHMVDVQLFGLAPGPHHLVNLFLHIINSLLLFYLFRRLTKTIWPAALVAALFALHPLHVESVAWVAERKDVLSGCFWMLTLISYCRYAERPSVKSYLPVVCFLGLGLMAKSMLVTLPFVMLLLDYWPLGRLDLRRNKQDNVSSTSLISLIREKAPLFLLTVIASVITLSAQQKAGAVWSSAGAPITARVANALVSYVTYLGKTIWPAQLAIYYPLRSLPGWQVAMAGLLLLAASLLIFRFSKSRPWLLAGWLWYLGTLVPVIGLVQVGSQAMADRYTYLPLIGIFIIIAWSLAELLAIRARLKPLLMALMFIVLVISTMTTRRQVSHWQNSISLYEQALASTTDNYLIQYNLALLLSDLGRLNEAAPHFAEALRIEPSPRHYFDYGLNLDRQGKYAEAERYYQKAVRLDTEHQYAREFHAHVYLGILQARRGFFAGATENFREELRLNPGNVHALFLLGNAMLEQGKAEEAFEYFTEAVRLDPTYTYAFCGLGDVKVRQGRPEEALAYFLEASRLAPEDPYVSSRVEFVRQVVGN